MGAPRTNGRGRSTRRGADRLLTARVRTLEHAVTPALVRALADAGLPGPLAARATTYVDALKTAVAGSFAWHRATGRFHRPLEAGAAR
ncbi:hypothetical protein [Streptomyces sp. Y1]|uniref:Uncharacterized protein n=1 Tax=Streptomyces sp. Y1 TaxID=3238634 RepID=A0AB39TUJ1_9ACTN